MAKKAHPHHTAEVKPDGSIVTNVDREVEIFLRKELLDMTPGAGFWGEEFGLEPPTTHGFWAVDPIDGTTNYSHGLPIWGVTAAYMVDGVAEVGAFVLPELDEMFLARRGCGATMNGEPIAPVRAGDIGPKELMAHGDGKMRWLGRVPGKPRHVGSFVVEAGYTALQRFRAMTTGNVCLYDSAAGVLVCREAGCDIRELDGKVWDEAEWQTGDRCRPFYIGPAGSQMPFGPNLAQV